MTGSRRALKLDDVAEIIGHCGARPDPAAAYASAARAAQDTCGWRLFTVLELATAENAVVRLWSSDPAAYPIGGSKPLDKTPAGRAQMRQDGEIFLAGTKKEVREAFFDHELIFSLGITAIMNVPVRHLGRTLGMLNFCGEDGMYGTREQADARVIAGLLAPHLLTARR